MTEAPVRPPRELVADAVTALFVPGDRPDRFAKAAAAGADVVIIDLEDAVGPTDKDPARDATLGALADGARLRALVRVNDPSGALGRTDRKALADLLARPSHGVLGVVVPKAGDPEALAELAGSLGPELAVVAIVESALGVVRAYELASAPGVTRLAFGALDLALDLGSDVDAQTGQVARAQVVLASRAAGLPAPLESPATELRDTDRIEQTSRAARALGFGGRLCIHPAQLAPVRAGFAPSPDEVEWARRIAAAGESATRVDDQMVDRPVLERARAILRRAGESG